MLHAGHGNEHIICIPTQGSMSSIYRPFALILASSFRTTISNIETETGSSSVTAACGPHQVTKITLFQSIPTADGRWTSFNFTSLLRQ